MKEKKEFIELKEILKGKCKIHFIGIGGTSMSGLAGYMKDMGYIVSGSDRDNNDYVKKLRKKGIEIFIGQKADNIRDYDLVIYTAAISENNPERICAKEKGIPMYERAVLLGYLMNEFKYSIGVAGTHGKTTTTSLIACAMLGADFDPTIMVGASLPNIGGNMRHGKSDYCVYEACEFVDSYHEFFPNIAIILNIEEDHLDYFKNLDNIIKSFKKYISNTGDNGYTIVCKDSANAMKAVDEYKGTVITYGIKNADYTVDNIVYDENGCGEFDVYEKGEFLYRGKLAVGGEHNVLNALAVTAALRLVGMDIEDIKKGLLIYTGAGRRFELVGYGKTGFRIYDDYAHHPTEVNSVLNVAKNLKCNKFWLIHQPHTFTRTKLLFNEWIECLSKVDNLILAEICPAREEDIYGISSQDLKDKLPSAVYLKSFEEIRDFCEKNLSADDVAMTVGCGDIYLAARLMAGYKDDE